MLAEQHLHKPEYQHFYSPYYKSQMMIAIAKHWKINGVMLRYNRGCEGLSMGIAENRLGILEAGIPVMTFEGNMGMSGNSMRPGRCSGWTHSWRPCVLRNRNSRDDRRRWLEA